MSVTVKRRNPRWLQRVTIYWSDRRKYQKKTKYFSKNQKSACNGYFSKKKIASGHIVYTSWNSSIVNAGRDTMCEIWFWSMTKRHEDICETRTEVSWFTTLSEIGRIDPEMNRSYWYDTCFVVVKNNHSCKNQCVQTCRQHVDSHYLSKLQSILDVHCIHPSMSDTLIRDTAASSMSYYHEANELHCFRCKVFVEQSSTYYRAAVEISETTAKYMDFPSSREITCVSW